MLLSLVVILAARLAVNTDTTVILGTREWDLTGDGKPEVMRLEGVGPSIDSLVVTFSIESLGTVLFSTELAPITRVVGYDRSRRRLSPAEHRARIRGFGAAFLDSSHFKRLPAFVRELGASSSRWPGRVPEIIARSLRTQLIVDSLIKTGYARGEAGWRAQVADNSSASYDTATGVRAWEEIQRRSSTVFMYSPGGDGIEAIAWSPRHGRFVRLMDCC